MSLPTARPRRADLAGLALSATCLVHCLALPMLLLHRVSYDVDGHPVERARSLYRGDRFSFVARLHADR